MAWLSSSLSSVLQLRGPRSRLQLDTAYRLVMVSRRWRARLSERLSAAGYTGSGFSALYALASAPSGLNQSELAERMGLTGSSLVPVLDLLERQGQIRREAVIGDRRANLVRLEPAGADAVRKLDAIAEGLRDEVFKDISDERLTEMSDLLTRLLVRLEPTGAGSSQAADAQSEASRDPAPDAEASRSPDLVSD